MPPEFLIIPDQNLVVAGIDEAGRGPLSGPVVAACVVLDKNNIPLGINDSKKLSRSKISSIASEIRKTSHFGIGIVSEKIIDEINILQATKLAMKNAYLDLCRKFNVSPEIILVDGNFIPFDKNVDKLKKLLEVLSVINGDQKDLNIAAASILAKDHRDLIMLKLHKEFPNYGWDKNNGYPTKLHLQKIKEFGICKYHRKSFNGCN